MAKGPFDAALQAWRETRHPGFAGILDALTAKEPARPLVGASGKKKDREAWDALADAGDVADMPRLLATIASGNSPIALARVQRLESRDDPRLVPALLRLVEDPPYTAGTSKKFWQAVLAAMTVPNDVRAREPMLDLAQRYRTINDTNLGSWLATQLNKLAAKIADPKPLGAKHAKLLAELEVEVLGAAGATRPKPKPKKSTSRAELLEAVIADLDDDTPRLVFADFVAEEGDPDRAEFIQLQIERAAGRATRERADLEREKYTDSELLKKWAVPIGTAASTMHFERGFPHQADLDRNGLATVVDAREWGTIRRLEHLSYAPVTAMLKLLDGKQVANVRSADGLKPKHLDKLKTPTFPWTYVGFIEDEVAKRHFERLPEVTSIHLYQSIPALDAFTAAPKLTQARINHLPDTFGAELFTHCPLLEHLEPAPNSVPERFAGLRVRSLKLTNSAADLDGWLRAIPTVKKLRARLYRFAWADMRALVEKYPQLDSVESEFGGPSTGRLERVSATKFNLVAPTDAPAPFYTWLVESADTLEPILEKIIVSNRAPRHETPAREAAAHHLAMLRDAYGDIEVRETL